MTQGKTNKTAVITGASSGIGRASAMELARHGYAVLICARTMDKLQQVEHEILSSGGEAHAMQCDVSVASDVKALGDRAARLWGRVDLLFNNAGSGKALSICETTDDDWETMIRSSLNGTFYCCREFLPLLRKAPVATIINNASVAAQRGFPNFTAYSAAKGGIASFSRALREELRPDGIRVTTLFAGATDTNFWDNLEGEWDRTRMMTCDSVGRLIVTIAETADCAQMEEVHLMPTGGAL